MTEEKTDIVERLKNFAEHLWPAASEYGSEISMLNDAAREVEVLRTALAEAEERAEKAERKFTASVASAEKHEAGWLLTIEALREQLAQAIEALERVRTWIDVDVPIGTTAATTIRGVVHEALSNLHSGKPE